MPSVTHIKITSNSFYRTRKDNYTFHEKAQKTSAREISKEQKYKIGLVKLSDLKMHYITIVIKCVLS